MKVQHSIDYCPELLMSGEQELNSAYFAERIVSQAFIVV